MPPPRDGTAGASNLMWSRRSCRESFEALGDRSSEVRKAAVKALVGVDDPRCADALQRLLPGANPKLASWIERVLRYMSGIDTLRRVWD